VADFHSKMSVCRHELGVNPPPNPHNSNPDAVCCDHLNRLSRLVSLALNIARGMCCRNMCVCLLRSDTVAKRLNVSSKFFHCLIVSATLVCMSVSMSAAANCFQLINDLLTTSPVNIVTSFQHVISLRIHNEPAERRLAVYHCNSDI